MGGRTYGTSTSIRKLQENWSTATAAAAGLRRLRKEGLDADPRKRLHKNRIIPAPVVTAAERVLSEFSAAFG
jgi:hypothetical protein